MSNNARNTQFEGFAKALFEELQAIDVEGLRNSWNNLDVYRRQREIIARRAYDLAAHVVENVSAYNVSSIPDMTELPKEQEESEMTEEQKKHIEDIHSIAFAAINQINYWNKLDKSPDVGSLKVAFEGIIKLVEVQEEALAKVEEWGVESQMHVVEDVKKDFKKLSDAIAALRKETISNGQED